MLIPQIVIVIVEMLVEFTLQKKVKIHGIIDRIEKIIS